MFLELNKFFDKNILGKFTENDGIISIEKENLKLKGKDL